MSLEWVLSENDFLSDADVKALRKTLDEAAVVAESEKLFLPIRDWAIFDLAMSSGLRASELCNLDVADLVIEEGQASIFVRNGKGGRSRSVAIPKACRRHLKRYLKIKRRKGEDVAPDCPLFCGRDGRISRAALHRRFKKWAKSAGLPERYSVHSLRHTYATHLLKASHYNLPLVQKQLGHSSVTVTEVYTHVIPQDLTEAVNGLYK